MGIGWIIFILATLGWHIGLFGMFKKAGIDGWKAFVPFYNTWCMVEKMPIKKYWFFLQLIPIAGQFITFWPLWFLASCSNRIYTFCLFSLYGF